LLTGFALWLLLAPSTAWPLPVETSPPDAFVAAVRILASAPGQAGPQRSQLIADATRQMAAALADWDRSFSSNHARISAELKEARGHRSAQLHAELGMAYLDRGAFSDAIGEFDAASAVESAADLQLLRAVTLAAAGSETEAGIAFRAAWNADRGNPAAAYFVIHGRGARADADAAAARTLLAETYIHPPPPAHRPPPFPVAGLLFDGLSRVPVIADDAVLAKAFAELNAGHYTDAVTTLSAAGRTTASPAAGVAAAITPLQHFVRARAYEAQNRVIEARQEYEALLPGTLFGRAAIEIGIARLAQVAGDLPGAIAAFTRAVALDPNNVLVHEELASADIADGRLDDAFDEAVAAMLIDPADGQAHAIVGQVRLAQGREADAVAAFTRALDLAPARYETRYALAQALQRLGREGDAARERERFERDRRDALERRRRAIADDVAQEEAKHQRQLEDGQTP
jgi:tetratricopeptide (TPR) repeat protein